jgi:hypothetical protein
MELALGLILVRLFSGSSSIQLELAATPPHLAGSVDANHNLMHG